MTVGSRHTNERNDKTTAHLADVFWHKPNRGTHLSRDANRQLRIEVCLFLRRTRVDQVVINIAALHAIQNIE